MATSISPLCSALQLTASPAAATNTAIVEGMCAHTLDFFWTPGTIGNVLTITIEHRVNASTNSSYIQEMQWNDSPAGTYVRTLNQLNHTATGTSEVPLSFFFQGHYGEIRIKVSESTAGGVTLGTISAFLTSSTTS